MFRPLLAPSPPLLREQRQGGERRYGTSSARPARRVSTSHGRGKRTSADGVGGTGVSLFGAATGTLYNFSSWRSSSVLLTQTSSQALANLHVGVGRTLPRPGALRREVGRFHSPFQRLRHPTTRQNHHRRGRRRSRSRSRSRSRRRVASSARCTIRATAPLVRPRDASEQHRVDGTEGNGERVAGAGAGRAAMEVGSGRLLGNPVVPGSRRREVQLRSSSGGRERARPSRGRRSGGGGGALGMTTQRQLQQQQQQRRRRRQRRHRTRRQPTTANHHRFLLQRRRVEGTGGKRVNATRGVNGAVDSRPHPGMVRTGLWYRHHPGPPYHSRCADCWIRLSLSWHIAPDVDISNVTAPHTRDTDATAEAFRGAREACGAWMHLCD